MRTKRELQEYIKELEHEIGQLPMKIWDAVSFLVPDENSEISSPLVEYKLFDVLYKEFTEIKIRNRNVIFIASEPKSRLKHFIIKDDRGKISHYKLNRNDLNLIKIVNELDKLNYFLVKISKSAIVNVEYFKLLYKKQLALLLTEEEINFDKNIIPNKVSTEFIQNFSKVQEAFDQRTSLQKRASHYKFSHGF
jgi:hypothetical protein